MDTFRIDESGDMVIDGTGRPELVDGTDKLGQLIKEVLLSVDEERGMSANLGRTGFDPETEIRNSMGVLKGIQDRSRAPRTSDEKYGSILALTVSRIAGRPTDIEFKLDVASVSGESTMVEGVNG